MGRKLLFTIYGLMMTVTWSLILSLILRFLFLSFCKFCGYFYRVIPVSQKHNLVQDIRLAWDGKTTAKDDSKKAITENHLANRLQYSLSVSSVFYNYICIHM